MLNEVSADDLSEFGLLPEFIGRLPVVSVLHELSEQELEHVLTDPANALVKQYKKLFASDGVELRFTDDAVERIAQTAMERGVGARGLRSIIEKTLESTMFELPELQDVEAIVVDGEAIDGKVEPQRVVAERRHRRVA
jgi:ATP-dependent Clp protease ATP-binding subunit ClpX